MILEIGSGRHPLNAEVSIDINPKASCDILSDAHNLPFRSACFTTIILAEVLEHTKHPFQVLEEIGRCLRKLGQLIVTIPNVLHYRAILRWMVKGVISPNPEHIYAWRLPEIKKLLSEAGYTVQLTEYQDTHDHRTSAFSNVLPRMLRRSLKIVATKGSA